MSRDFPCTGVATQQLHQGRHAAAVCVETGRFLVSNCGLYNSCSLNVPSLLNCSLGNADLNSVVAFHSLGILLYIVCLLNKVRTIVQKTDSR